ncbi:DeoR family transcriptional regulator [Brooklawnia cerclae]|uniref:DeoR/GlpR family transcriptional regulator of sugar metabolism n=1 Tax=Brooklawnia cerclae TaxID=349934 RepID=A0ABX0SJ93_9ACTN|nr:DeoR/GlpR family transcriptional regulator of sugar metabolism [Brooklawnia cerclae]
MSQLSRKPLRRRAGKGELRRERIVRILSDPDTGNIRNRELAEALGVSIATVRRDLALLQEKDAVSRTYGGVSVAPTRREIAMGSRERSAARQKNAIARTAVGLLSDGDLVILDAGSTAEQVAVEMGNRLSLTVVTNGIRAINRLAVQDHVQVMVLGGYLRGSNGTICGGEAEAMIGRVRADYAFLGAVHVSPHRGIASLTYDQARLKSMMMQQAREIYVIADSTKIVANDAYPFWSPLPSHWGLITDDGVNRELLAGLRAEGADPVIVVAPDADPV